MLSSGWATENQLNGISRSSLTHVMSTFFFSILSLNYFSFIPVFYLQRIPECISQQVATSISVPYAFGLFSFCWFCPMLMCQFLFYHPSEACLFSNESQKESDQNRIRWEGTGKNNINHDMLLEGKIFSIKEK